MGVFGLTTSANDSNAGCGSNEGCDSMDGSFGKEELTRASRFSPFHNDRSRSTTSVFGEFLQG